MIVSLRHKNMKICLRLFPMKWKQENFILTFYELLHRDQLLLQARLMKMEILIYLLLVFLMFLAQILQH